MHLLYLIFFQELWKVLYAVRTTRSKVLRDLDGYSSCHVVEQSPSTIERNRRRIMSGLKKRSPPVGASSRTDGVDDAPIAPAAIDRHDSHVSRFFWIRVFL